MDKRRIIRAGVIGTGFIAIPQIESIRRIPGIELAALCETEPDRSGCLKFREPTESERVIRIGVKWWRIRIFRSFITARPMNFMMRLTGQPYWQANTFTRKSL